MSATRPITLLIAALGGEGGGVLADWIIAAAMAQDYPVQSTSIPGVAQRTGATTYYVEVAPEAAERTAGGAPTAPGAPRPIFSLSPVPGCIDLLVSSELLETLRQAGAGFISQRQTIPEAMNEIAIGKR